MVTQDVIEQYRNVLFQIATPTGTGTGFYLKEHKLIVTNRHVIQGNNDVVISSRNLPKHIAKVVYRDSIHDLAFIQIFEDRDMPHVSLAAPDRHPREGDQIIAIGHPYGLKYTATQGIVSKSERVYNNVGYIQVDAAINPGNSGGPLINAHGEIVGVNTFIIADGNNLGFALPVKHLHESLIEFSQKNTKDALRCNSCSVVSAVDELEGGYCPNCGNKIDENEYKPKPFQPSGIAKTIESILEKLGRDVRLARMGPASWDIEEGSARIRIDYHTNTRFVVADALLCKLPKTNIAAIYEFLLRENYKLDGLLFSINNQDIMLSLLIYDEDINMETGVPTFGDLFKFANHYDDILLNEMGAVALNREED
jgi:serine protease Do